MSQTEEYKFASEMAAEASHYRMITDAAVEWQNASDKESVAQSLWSVARESGSDDEPQLYKEFRWAEEVKNGWLAQLALRTRLYTKTASMMALTLLAFTITATAQTFPRWPQGQTVKVYTLTNAFTDKEHARITAAVESWRPLLPSGITLTLAGETSHTMDCQGCVTINRSPVRKERWGEAEPHSFNDVAWYAIIRTDPRVGSGDAFQHTVEHEIGHVLGLDHRAKSVMSPRPKRGPSGDDGVILRGLYAERNSNGDTKAKSNIASESQGAESADENQGRMYQSGGMAGNENVADSGILTRALAMQERATITALERYSFRRAVSIQTLALDDPTIITGTYERISRIVLADNGERVERVISKHSHLKDLRITKADEEDFSGAQMGLLDFVDYRFTQGDNGAIHVEPITLDGRKFSGDIWIGDKGIVRMVGTTLPERKERFPVVTVTRKEIEGHLFPSEASGEGVLVFPGISIRVRWSVRESDYYRFGSRVTVKEVE